jgi:hypothetical protein
LIGASFLTGWLSRGLLPAAIGVPVIDNDGSDECPFLLRNRAKELPSCKPEIWYAPSGHDPESTGVENSRI